ncbi:MAG: hypothetical protein AAFW89_06955 [Bacteroidota bacterium]
MTSCYSPSGTHFVDTELNPDVLDPSFHFSPSVIIGDTIKVSQEPHFFFTFDRTQYQVDFFTTWVNSDSLLASSSRSVSDTGYSVPLQTSGLDDGEHTLTVVIRYKSNSGSVLDQMNLEFIEQRLLIPFWLETSPQEQFLNVQSIQENPDGTVTVAWDMYRSIQFGRYLVNKEVDYWNSGNYTSIFTQSVENQQTPVFIDSAYAGRSARYSISYQLENQHWFEDPIPGGSIDIAGGKPKLLAFETLAANQNRVTWTQFNHPLVFQEYEIRVDQPGSVPNLPSRFTVTSPDDTVLVFNHSNPRRIILYVLDNHQRMDPSLKDTLMVTTQ